MNSSAPISSRKRITVTGIVQGVGFRPYVYKLATECALAGSIRNDGQGVLIDVQGTRVDEFVRRLPLEAPPLVLITGLDAEECPLADATEFRILASGKDQVTSAMIPADVATCDDCLREILDPHDRRHRYPFTNCTNCGPRYTITRSIPYDRPSTSMHVFPMCETCAQEYHDPANRRFHAQPNACPVCGPQLLWRRNAQLHGEDIDIEGEFALQAATRELREGRILALRGLGGYHLAVDACNDASVRLLRLRKHRYAKPLAIMVRDLEHAAQLCDIGEHEAALLESPQHPIVILRLANTHPIAASVSLDNPTLGVMLPYTPLHHLLMRDVDRPLVMTSGNLSEEAICIDIDDAEQRLAGIADAFLHHNRDILQRCDDSVCRVIADTARPVRRARGYVPRPILLPAEAPSVIAVGGELKNTLGVSKGRAVFLSQHIGDLEHLEALRFFEETLSHLLRIFDVAPRAIAHDLHPDYLSTQWANGRLGGSAAERFHDLPRIAVQHHHAHLVSCLAEHGRDDSAIGVILDGTGYGDDGTIWGGEFLVGNSRSFLRAGHFGQLSMPGGERATREPWRMACAALDALHGHEAVAMFPEWFARRNTEEIEAARFSLDSGVNLPSTSSCGRLFDAVASLVGLHDTVQFEAQAAMALEFTAAPLSPLSPYPFEVLEGTTIVLSFLPTIGEIIKDMRSGKSVHEISARFHRTIIEGCAEVVAAIAASTGLRDVALSGGSFQNALLLDGLLDALRTRNFNVLTHRQVPANDGGIALGQAVIAHSHLKG
jgi:hydrogenase maturation protein HypF